MKLKSKIDRNHSFLPSGSIYLEVLGVLARHHTVMIEVPTQAPYMHEEYIRWNKTWTETYGRPCEKTGAFALAAALGGKDILSTHSAR
jgi:hypothetical protein